ncbi:altronate dehydratase family protein [Roseibacterium sp. SDUM158017]|uniref:UxaA family hydrolase n=1 Tax=Roseicyclus salinarum TaxID=3036773 RepID=UPI0024155C13|nr:altronate dehydratase family protein [Roseibacterium sp. SDUM158017]MDG4648675.1 altronate dehydratase family protein [Roseibacterium sp. SDUM158017]
MRYVKLDDTDNVVVAIESLVEGEEVLGIPVRARIPRGHKMAVSGVAKGDPFRKYGQIIGFASEDVAPGEWVHDHNLRVEDFERLAMAANPTPASIRHPEAAPGRSFDGFHRPNGRVGTRNYIAILTSVNCAASAARFIADEVTRSGALSAFPNVDGVIALVHGTGCGLDVNGAAHDVLRRTQWGYATNPNVGGVLMVGLGCEVFQIRRWMDAYGIEESDIFRSLTIQGSGGTRRTVEQGVVAVREMLPAVNAIERRPAPVAELTLALQCGGSDGYSGITANPALGVAVDMLVAAGGTAILSETPEIYGAEHLLMARAASPDVAEKLAERVRWWEDYTRRHDMQMNNNPSPGNKAGGLSSIVEKSLGAAAKGGSSTLMAVYHYADPVTERGLVFMDTPGYDPVSATGQVAGGANVMCFTTGRGSAFGGKPTPSLKLASNSPLFASMADDMDINCGDVLDGVSLHDKGAEIFEHIVATASGARTKSELLGYGDYEFVPWSLGATM